jgi:hypothetical protein
MKKNKFGFWVIILPFILMCFPSCMSSTYVNVLKPADVAFPEHVKKIAVTNRNLPDKKEDKLLNIAEGILSGEGLFVDREGGAECLSGFMYTLSQTPRFETVHAAGVELKGTGTGIFPVPLSWEAVNEICQKNNSNALAILEVFDSDSRIDYATRPKTIKDKEGNSQTITEHLASRKIRVTTGWRVYDPQLQKVIDEYRTVDEMGFDAVGNSPEQAASRLPLKREAVKRTGNYAGANYATRISPQWIRVTRSFYTGAAESWKKLVETADKKTAGRACYNMALFCEIEGKLGVALEYANRSYQDFGNKNARNYISVLNQRIAEDNRLKQQMGEGDNN